MRRIVCFVLMFFAATLWMSSAALAQSAGVQQMEAELAACPQKISALKGDIAAAKEAIEKQKPVVAAARLNAKNYTPENFPDRPDLVRETQNKLAAEMGFLSGLEQRLKDKQAELSTLEARCSKLKSDLAAAKAKAAEEKAAREAEEKRKADEARRKAEEDARKKREAKARCEQHRKNIQARREQLTKARDSAAKAVQDTLYTLSGMQMALVLMHRLELDTQINRGKLQTLITIAEGMNSDVKQTLIDAAMEKYASMTKTFGTGAVTAMTGVKTLEQIRRYERTQNLCIKTGDMYDNAEASSILKGQFQADDGQVDYVIGMICDQWAGENAAKRAKDLSSSWTNLQEATAA
ncbi:MAG: hypothetical protein R3360_07545, partial [Alphaproteobacteria bacterium]|nr:hypothetical protein [Alphaproteobacteria bacterium]